MTNSFVDINPQRQIGEVRSRGVEFEGKVNLDQNWKLLGSYSYTDLEITKDMVERRDLSLCLLEKAG